MKITEENQDPDLDPCSSGPNPSQNFTDPEQWQKAISFRLKIKIC